MAMGSKFDGYLSKLILTFAVLCTIVWIVDLFSTVYKPVTLLPMEYALTISLVANIVLAVLWFRRTSFYHCRFVFWFRKRPEFSKVEETARRIIGEASFGNFLDFDGFEAREWMADLTVRHKSLNKESHADTWKAVQDLVARLSKETGLPCWPYGWSMDKDNPRLNVGSLIGIGYGGCGPKQKRKADRDSPPHR